MQIVRQTVNITKLNIINLAAMGSKRVRAFYSNYIVHAWRDCDCRIGCFSMNERRIYHWRISMYLASYRKPLPVETVWHQWLELLMH